MHLPCILFPQVLFGINQRLRMEDIDSPLTSVRPVKTVMLVVLTGDRGLCGGYNNFILKKVRPHTSQLNIATLYLTASGRQVLCWDL